MASLDDHTHREQATPLVAVVILNWNGRRWLAPCLDSVSASEYTNIRVYLVDNGSSDGSQEVVRERYPGVTLIQNHRNLGVAEGFNVGARQALRQGADYIALLNEDVKVEPGWLGPLIKAAQADQTIGVLSPIHWDYEGTELDHHFHELLLEQTPYEEDLRKGPLPPKYETDRVIGAAMVMSRPAVQRVGLFDPLYFMYHEETDFCRRARYHGFRPAVVTGSRIFHYNQRWHGQQRTPYLHARNIQLYNWKDPEWSIWKKIKFSLGFSKNFAKITGWPGDLYHGLIMAYIQIWVLAHLPAILWRTRKERRCACYLE
jgi:GT2 family glycosyltransferase